MSKNPDQKTSNRPAASSSMVWKLNRYWMLHQLWVFIRLDILLFMLFCVGFFFVLEEHIAYIYRNMETIPRSVTSSDITGSDITGSDNDLFSINILEAAEGSPRPKGITFPRELHFLLPEDTKNGSRYFSISAPALTWWRFFDASQYTVTVPVEIDVAAGAGGADMTANIADNADADNLGNSGATGITNTSGAGYISITYQAGYVFRIFRYLFTVILAWQLLIWLVNISSGARAARSVLRPIAEMASKADSLGARDAARQDPAALADLAGAIDRINISRLDTRISIEDCPEELRELAMAINTMLDHIEESYRQQARFVSDASHELRTPIAVIKGYANLLDRWGKSDEKTLQESIDALKAESERMKILVESLLFLAKGESDNMPFTLEYLNITTILQEIYNEYKMIDQQHNWTFTSTEPYYVYADAALFKQALRILTDNALQYTPEGGEIEFLVHKNDHDGTVTIAVQDSGIGIPAEDLPYIFDRFYRSDSSRVHRKSGSGLGLPIAKWIISKHNGAWEVLSRQGLGTRIMIKLPEAGGRG